jgi:hypothetical protein
VAAREAHGHTEKKKLCAREDDLQGIMELADRIRENDEIISKAADFFFLRHAEFA